MSVTTLELVEIVPYVWDCVLGQSVDPVAIELDWGDHKHLCAVISISGQWTGDVVLESSVEVARAAASRMFSTPEEDLAFDEVQDALAELANVIGGNIKSLVPGPSHLGLPSVTSGSHFDHRYSFAAQLCEASFAARGAGFRVSVWEKIERDTGAPPIPAPR